MQGSDWGPPRYLPAVGCASLLFAFFLLCLMPVLFVEAMGDALRKLHLHPAAAGLAVAGILLGSFVNIPIARLSRSQLQPWETLGTWGLWGWTERFAAVRPDTIVAVNVGGCVIPVLLSLWEVRCLALARPSSLGMLSIACAANIGICYAISRPVPRVGILMPGFISPFACILLAWFLLPGGEAAHYRAPVAFIAGVTGPLVGADLLRLPAITRVSVGVLSIGGAGTFDGILLSGIVAALFA